MPAKVKEPGWYVRFWRGVRPQATTVFVLTACLTMPIALWTYVLSGWKYSGCFIDCSSEPDPESGLYWAAVTAVLILLPFVAAVVVQKAPVSERVRWVIAFAVPVAVVLTYVYAPLGL